MAIIHLNGRLLNAATARIDPADRGLLLADGLFETLRAYGGQPFALEAHLTRLAQGAEVLGLPMPAASELTQAVAETLAANRLTEASLRITLTRGSGPRGLLPPEHPTPTLLVTANPTGAAPAGWRARITAIRRNEHSPLSRLKTLAYLDNLLALRQAAAAGADEALMLNTGGRLAGGSRSNLFLVLSGVLVTPPESEGVLPGIARRQLLALAAEAGIATRESPLSIEDLELATEAFVSNSVVEVVPLLAVDGGGLPPGPVTGELARRYAELARAG